MGGALSIRACIEYYSYDGQEVVIMRADPPGEDDTALERFLEFLAADITHHPNHLRCINPALHERIQSLVGDVKVDLDVPLPTDDS